MAEPGKLARTMRIDLIPDTPAEPTTGRKRIIMATPTNRHKRIHPSAVKGKESDTRYQKLLQSVYDAVLISDMDGKIVDANIRAVDFLNFTREELCSISVFDIITGSDASLIQTLLENLKNERFTLIQAYCVRNDGSYFPSEIAVNKLDFDQPYLCFFLRDITLRRQAEEMLKTEHNAIQNSGNGIAVVDLQHHFEYVNPALASMWGFNSTEEIIGQDLGMLFSDKQAINQMAETVMGGQQIWTGEMQAAHNGDGGSFDVQVSAALNRNTDGESVGMVLSFVDISDRKRAEEAVRETERTKVMLESLGAACHHLGQPATVLLANIGIIQHHLKETDNELVGTLLQNSADAAERLGEILHKLNEVNEYRTIEYVKSNEDSDSEESRILDI